MIRRSVGVWTGLLLLVGGGATSLNPGCCSAVAAQETPFLTTRQPLTLLSANDGASLSRWGGTDVPSEADAMPDSITVIHLGPDHPPVTTTVYGTVPNTINGSPYMAIAGDGRFGFVTNHSWRFEPETGRTDADALPPLSSRHPERHRPLHRKPRGGSDRAAAESMDGGDPPRWRTGVRRRRIEISHLSCRG